MKKIKYIIVPLLIAGIATLCVYISNLYELTTSFKLISVALIIILPMSFLLAHFYKTHKPLTESHQEKEDTQNNKLVIKPEVNGNYTVGNMIFKPKEHSFYKGNERRKISKQMTQMLLVFFVSPDFLVLREELIQLWDPSYNNDVKLNTGILRLREKLGEIKCPLEIATERNIGYRLIYKEIVEEEKPERGKLSREITKNKELIT